MYTHKSFCKAVHKECCTSVQKNICCLKLWNLTMHLLILKDKNQLYRNKQFARNLRKLSRIVDPFRVVSVLLIEILNYDAILWIKIYHKHEKHKYNYYQIDEQEIIKHRTTQTFIQNNIIFLITTPRVSASKSSCAKHQKYMFRFIH